MNTKLPRRLRRNQPIAVLDLETTGLAVERDRIVEVGMLRIARDGSRKHFRLLVDPEINIPREAARVHGITNRHVKGKPNFRSVAHKLLRWLSGCDLVGFNIRNFDLPLLKKEFSRAGVTEALTKSFRGGKPRIAAANGRACPNGRLPPLWGKSRAICLSPSRRCDFGRLNRRPGQRQHRTADPAAGG